MGDRYDLGGEVPGERAENAGLHAFLDQFVDSVRRCGGVFAVDLRRRLVTDHVVVEGVGMLAHGRADAGEVEPDPLSGVGRGTVAGGSRWYHRSEGRVLRRSQIASAARDRT